MWLKNQNQLTIHIFCLYFDADRLFRYVFVSCVEWAVLVKNNVVLFFAQLRLHGETRCRILAGIFSDPFYIPCADFFRQDLQDAHDNKTGFSSCLPVNLFSNFARWGLAMTKNIDIKKAGCKQMQSASIFAL